jgi:hypothetical protein
MVGYKGICIGFAHIAAACNEYFHKNALVQTTKNSRKSS